MTKKVSIVILSSVVLLAGLIYLLVQHDQHQSKKADELVVHCAAGLQKPIRVIAQQYEKEFGTKIRLNFAASGVLASQLEVAGGDLFIPADQSYNQRAQAKGLVTEFIPLAELRACIVVQKGNPLHIQSLQDLTQPNIRISVADPSAAVGKFVKKVLSDSGDWEKIQAQIVVVKPTVNNIVEDVSIKSVDAALAWDAVALQSPHVEIVRVPVFEKKPRRASVGLIRNAQLPSALHFARYLSAIEKGRSVFATHHFSVPQTADHWADTPELLLFSGSMLRPAIQDRIRAFEKREGCRVSTVFEGCGTLVGMMAKGGAKPDSMFFCDSSFYPMVKDDFQAPHVISSNKIILLVPKGNPKHIKNLQDLVDMKLKVGISDPQKSALGALTKRMLISHHLWKPLQSSGNIIVRVGKGDELVNQMQVGALDAAILYRSNALASHEIMESCTIVALHDPLASATQPYAVSTHTDYPNMAQRLCEFLTNDDAKKNYTDLGFEWEK